MPLPTASLVLFALVAQPVPERLAGLAAPLAGLRAQQFSSRDPAGSNVDHGHFVGRLDDGDLVMAKAEGPGAVCRVWSANPAGEVRLELDGEVAWRGPFADYFAWQPEGSEALAGPSGGGFVSYVRRSFRRSFRMVLAAGSTDASKLYYHVGIERGVREVDSEAAAEAAPIATHSVDFSVPGGGREPVLEVAGPVRVVEVRLSMAAWPPPRAAWLLASVDGAPPAVIAPLADLFGFGGAGGPGLETGVVGSAGAERFFRMPMPCKQRLEFTIEHCGDRTEPPVEGRLVVDAVALPVDHRECFLHARFHRAATEYGQPFRVLDLAGAGAGHFAGVVMSFAPDSGQGLSYLEGDERITVDGRLAFAGTGTEDYFSGAWYFRGGPFGHRFGGVSVIDGEGRITAARWHVRDPVPFAQSLRFELEHGGNNDCPRADYSALAFFYLDDPAGRLQPPRPLRRRWSELPQRRPQPRRLPVTPARPLSSGRHEISLDAPEWQFAQATPLDAAGVPLGQPLQQTVWSAGPADLSGLPRVGMRQVELRLSRDGEVAAVLFEPYLPALRQWHVVGPFAAVDRKGIDTVYPPERDWDASSYETEAGTVAWQPLDLRFLGDGVADLDPLFDRADHAVAYAKTVIECEHAGDAVLVLGSDDAVCVFLNGERVHRNAVLRGVGRDQDRVPITLRSGDNDLVLKVEDYSGGWGFVARVER